jgi:hypothetical protein
VSPFFDDVTEPDEVTTMTTETTDTDFDLATYLASGLPPTEEAQFRRYTPAEMAAMHVVVQSRWVACLASLDAEIQYSAGQILPDQPPLCGLRLRRAPVSRTPASGCRWFLIRAPTGSAAQASGSCHETGHLVS